MKRRMEWQSVSRADLAEHLKCAEVLDSEALAGASLYRCQGKDGESVAISLPDGETGLIIKVHFEIPASLKRRRKQGENAPRDECAINLETALDAENKERNQETTEGCRKDVAHP